MSVFVLGRLSVTIFVDGAKSSVSISGCFFFLEGGGGGLYVCPQKLFCCLSSTRVYGRL